MYVATMGHAIIKMPLSKFHVRDQYLVKLTLKQLLLDRPTRQYRILNGKRRKLARPDDSFL
jgi:hypothetical protein